MAVYVAIDAFYSQPKGQPGVYVRRGDTVEEGHQLLTDNPHAFKPQQITHALPKAPEPKPKPKPLV